MRKLSYVIIVLLAILIVSMLGIFSGQQPESSISEKNQGISILEITKDKANVGKQFSISLLVKDFSYDEESALNILFFQMAKIL